MFSSFNCPSVCVCVCVYMCVGEGGLEVCCHGDRSDLPVDVHHRVSARNHRTLPSPVALWNDLEPQSLLRRKLELSHSSREH